MLRAPYDKVLIVTEGSKTEPAYFEEIKDYYDLSGANVVIDGRSGTNPINVVEYGEHLYGREMAAGIPFDRVYFVFDKDRHAKYKEALNRIAHLSPGETFYAANSVPCFEYWLLLHFAYTTSPFQPREGQSSSAAVVQELKKHMPNYRKSMEGVFGFLRDRLETAKENASKSLKTAMETGTDNPSTRVHELVHYLQNIRSSS